MTNRFHLQDVNPLRGLTETRLASMLDLGDRGAYAELQWLYLYIERRNATARAVKRRLMSALGGVDWRIKTADAGDDQAKQAAADAQADTLRAAYDRIENLRDALHHLALAEMRGFSHVEKIYAPDWSIAELRPVEQWFWVRDGRYSPWHYNRDATVGVTRGEAIVRRDWIIREIDDPANEVIARAHVRQETSDADWDGYLEDYGVPPMFFEMPPNVPPEREREYQDIAEKTMSRAKGAVPSGTGLLTPPSGGSGGAGIFRDRLDYLREEIVIAGTSGMLTVLTEAGSGTLAGGAQADTFLEVAQSIALRVSECMQRDFDRAILSAAHPGEPVLAYFEFAAVDDEDAGKILEDAGKATAAGFSFDADELSELTGYTLTAAPRNFGQDGQDLQDGKITSAVSPRHPVPPVNPVQSAPPPDPEQINALNAAALDQLLTARAADLAPLRRAVENAVADPSPERLRALLADLPGLQSQLGIAEADVLRRTLGTALVSGLT